jgi:hypothetical protein
VSIRKALAQQAASGVQAALRRRVEALPRWVRADSALSCAVVRERFFYIDRVNGSDETGDGSEERPFRSDERVAAVCAERGYRIAERGMWNQGGER